MNNITSYDGGDIKCRIKNEYLPSLESFNYDCSDLENAIDTSVLDLPNYGIIKVEYLKYLDDYLACKFLSISDKAFKRLLERAGFGGGDYMLRLGKAYRDGTIVRKDLVASEAWLKKAVNVNANWIADLLSVQYELNSSDFIPTLRTFTEKGNAEAEGWLGRAYRDGRGVKKDLQLAKQWMRKAADSNLLWPKWDYIDILWSINTAETDREMIEYARPFAEKGLMEIQERLGRAYRDGRGVEKDIELATYWLKKASDQNHRYAKIELFDILWVRNDPESDIEMFELVNGLSNTGDGNVLARLARCYRDGRGVKKDLQLAKQIYPEGM